MDVRQRTFNYERILSLPLGISSPLIFERVSRWDLSAPPHILCLAIAVFIPHVKRFFDENLLLSTGYTARETLK